MQLGLAIRMGAAAPPCPGRELEPVLASAYGRIGDGQSQPSYLKIANYMSIYHPSTKICMTRHSGLACNNATKVDHWSQ